MAESTSGPPLRIYGESACLKISLLLPRFHIDSNTSDGASNPRMFTKDLDHAQVSCRFVGD